MGAGKFLFLALSSLYQRKSQTGVPEGDAVHRQLSRNLLQSYVGDMLVMCC